MASLLANMNQADLRLPEELKDKSVGYDSDIWIDYRASDIFIKPTATSGEGITYLKIVTLAGASKAASANKALTEHELALDNDCKYLIISNGLMSGDKFNDSCVRAISYNNRAINIIRGRQALVEPVRMRAHDLFKQFRHVGRLCEQIEEMQRAHREKLILEPKLIAKLMVAMKCLDASWHSTVILYQEIRSLNVVISSDLDVQLPSYMNFGREGMRLRLVRDTVNGPHVVEGWQSEEDEDEQEEDDDERGEAMTESEMENNESGNETIVQDVSSANSAEDQLDLDEQTEKSQE